MNSGSLQEVKKAEFKAAYDEYANAIYRFCVLKTSQPELATDLMQETFMRFWQSLRDGKEMTNPRSFLYTVAGNLVIDWYRKKKSDSLDMLQEGGFDPADSKELSLEDLSEHQEILKVINQLEEKDQTVLLLRYVEGLEPRDIAAQIGESANVVSVRINRAVKKVQELMHTTK